MYIYAVLFPQISKEMNIYPLDQMSNTLMYMLLKYKTKQVYISSNALEVLLFPLCKFVKGWRI